MTTLILPKPIDYHRESVRSVGRSTSHQEGYSGAKRRLEHCTKVTEEAKRIYKHSPLGWSKRRALQEVKEEVYRKHQRIRQLNLYTETDSLGERFGPIWNLHQVHQESLVQVNPVVDLDWTIETLKTLPYIWDTTYRKDDGGYTRIEVYFKPLTYDRYCAERDLWEGDPTRAYPFKWTLSLHPDIVTSTRNGWCNEPDGYPLGHLYPHHGCYGSSEAHLKNALRYGNIVNYFSILHSYICMANHLDEYGPRIKNFKAIEHTVPPDDEITLEHYTRWIPAESEQKEGLYEECRSAINEYELDEF